LVWPGMGVTGVKAATSTAVMNAYPVVASR
jgi:hypothetical protein